VIGYPDPGALADAAAAGACDAGFLANEPQRARDIEFSPAYVEIEATYLVPPLSPLRAVAEVDRPGVRVAVPERAAYELFLSRTLRHAQLLRASGAERAFERFVAEKLDALAGLRPRLVRDAEKLPGSRVLEDRFTAVQQAIGTPKGRAAAARYLREFVEEAKASGLVARLIEANGVRGLTVAPPSAG
jgi:polar amino acid transport system substrate-binding protein